MGAGGKTTALFALARQIPSPVIVTTTTHLGAWQLSQADTHFVVTNGTEALEAVRQAHGVTALTGVIGADQRAQGLNDEILLAIHQAADFPILIEADGARGKPLKSPAEHEPVLPAWVNQVVCVAGLSAVGKSLNEETVHRADRFGSLAKAVAGELITPEHILKALCHPSGGLKNIPTQARRILLLNQADDQAQQIIANAMAESLLSSWDSVLVSSFLKDRDQQVMTVHENTAGVLLAAGSASRFGQPKVLLDWHGKTLLRHIAEIALQAGLSPVIVVAGAEVEQIRAALADLPVRIVENTEWLRGQSTSLQAGLNAISPAHAGSAIFLLGDQPFVPPDLLYQLCAEHLKILAPIVAPRVNGQRANPVLFDRSTFPELLTLQGDQGGRKLFDRYSPHWIEWEDARLLEDIDTPEDYQRLLTVIDP